MECFLWCRKSEKVGGGQRIDQESEKERSPTPRGTEKEHRVEGRREFQMLQSNIRRIAVQPVVRRATAVANSQMEELELLCQLL
jgi:hypothetical protein